MSGSSHVRASQVLVGGVRSPVLEAGPPGDEAVVFLHGNPGSSRDWEDLLPEVGAFARAVAFDMPGFGRADKPGTFDYSVAGYARHLDGVLKELGVVRVHLVLHDFGGPWGLTWAAHHSRQFASVALINVGIMPGYRWHYWARIWRTPLLGEVAMATTTRASFTASLKHGNPRSLPQTFIDRMYDDFDRGTRRAVLRLYRATSDPGGATARELAGALRPLDCPALVLWGKGDPYVPVEYAERQREVFPSARVVILENSGHWPFADDPERVAAELIPFLRVQMLPATGRTGDQTSR